MHTLCGMHPSKAAEILFGMRADHRSLSAAEVKAVFRRRAHQLHPDTRTDGHHTPSVVFSELVTARDVLLDHLVQAAAPPKPQTIRPSQPSTHQGGGYPFHIVRPRQQKPHSEKLPQKSHERYYSGVFPTYPVKFGQFLYFSGVISWQDLVRGMRWQREQRPAFGELAVMWGWLCEKDVRAIRAATDIPGVFGERATALGLLTEKQANFLARHQHHSQPRLGEYFIRNRLLTERDVKDWLRKLECHNRACSRDQGKVS